MVIIGLVICSGDPFYTEARQRIDGTRYFTMRKYYGGLGRLLETQVLGAELSSGSQDVVVSSWQGYALEGGQVRAVQAQSVPYAIPAGYGFRGWDYVIDNSYAFSQTVLDELGRPVTVTAPDGTSTSYAYDDGYSNYLPFLQTTVTDAEGHATVTNTDIWGRTVLVDAPDGPSVSYSYDVSDRLVGVMYGTASTVLQYDLAGRKLSMDDPDMGDWTYTYDALGNLQTQTDARGCTTTLSYDLINRLENKSYSGSCGASTAAVTYTYDQGTNGVGQRTRMDDGTGYTTWSYDARGRVIETYQSVTGSGNFITQWGYNSADLPVWMRYPLDNAEHLGETVNFTYNPQMLLDRVYGTDTYVDDTWYDAAGRVTLRELGYGTNNHILEQSYTYYPWTQQGGRLQSLQSGLPSDQDSLQSLTYGYDEVGNVLSIIDYKAGGTQTQTFTYDDLDRLVSAVASGGTGGTYSLQNYTYNPDTGNLASNAGVTYTYGDNNHKHAVTGTSSGNIYSYDANGNQTSRRVGGVTYTLVYDAENRLVQIKRGSNIQATYYYDGDGNRIRTEVGSTFTTYIGSHLERECIDSTCAMKKYYYAAGQRVALRKGDGTLYFLLTDHLGSTAITATSSGGRDAELRYYPWGGTRYTYGTTPTSYRYTGQREAEVGLYYYGARFYDPYLNRWIQPDSIIPDQYNPMDWDRFNYVRNNPLVYIDSSGHDPEATEPNPPIFTYDEEHGFCINIFRVGCTGGDSYREWYFNWYLPRLPEFTHSHLTEISLFSQDVALGASSAGAGFEVVGFLAGGHPGAIAGNALHQSTTNPIESIASGVSTGATLLDDIFFTPGSGSYMNDAGVFVISDATATSVVATVIGSIVPIAMVDSAIDGYASRYNHGQAPGIFEWLGINGVTLFGLIQLGQ